MCWNNDVVLEFVELYRRQQLLWDPKHPSYRNRSEIAAAWLSIQRSLSIQCSISELKRKKESLMTSFRMHFSKKKRQDSYRTTWFAYPLMESFLGGKYECDSTVNQIENEFSTVTSNNIERSRKRNTIDRNNSSANIQLQVDGSVKNEPDISYTKKQRAEITYCNVNDMKADTDECDLYAQLLAKKLRKLNEHQRDVAMHEIDNIMFRAKMQNGGPSQRKSFSSSPSPVTRKVQSPIFIVTPQNHLQYEDENISYQEEVSQVQNPP
ncbi:unnamed protein product [Diatraea saccharalis]|uniref:MADF domain-containing protein n=1 Tax=Diatraea saccharalis TaxID=40085 RepID=A0A9N9WCH8_9NEOP|nr:unnamed protein product [Diatraea saccharalis]